MNMTEEGVVKWFNREQIKRILTIFPINFPITTLTEYFWFPKVEPVFAVQKNL